MSCYINGYSGGVRWSAVLPTRPARTWTIVFSQGPRVVIEMWTNKRSNMACEEQSKDKCLTCEKKDMGIYGGGYWGAEHGTVLKSLQNHHRQERLNMFSNGPKGRTSTRGCRKQMEVQ